MEFRQLRRHLATIHRRRTRPWPEISARQFVFRKLHHFDAAWVAGASRMMARDTQQGPQKAAALRLGHGAIDDTRKSISLCGCRPPETAEPSAILSALREQSASKSNDRPVPGLQRGSRSPEACRDQPCSVAPGRRWICLRGGRETRFTDARRHIHPIAGQSISKETPCANGKALE